MDEAAALGRLARSAAISTSADGHAILGTDVPGHAAGGAKHAPLHWPAPRLRRRLAYRIALPPRHAKQHYRMLIAFPHLARRFRSSVRTRRMR